MASFSNLTASGSSTDATSYSTASITPAANSLLLLAIETDRALGDSVAPTTPVPSGLGATWIQIQNVYFDQSGSTYRLTVFYGVGATGSGAITIDYGGVTQYGCSWIVDQVLGATRSAPIIKQSKKSAEPAASLEASISLSLDASITPGNVVWMCATWEAVDTGTAENGWTLLTTAAGHSSPSATLASMARGDNVDNSGTISWTFSAFAGAVIVEIIALPFSLSWIAVDDVGFHILASDAGKYISNNEVDRLNLEDSDVGWKIMQSIPRWNIRKDD